MSARPPSPAAVCPPLTMAAPSDATQQFTEQLALVLAAVKQPAASGAHASKRSSQTGYTGTTLHK